MPDRRGFYGRCLHYILLVGLASVLVLAWPWILFVFGLSSLSPRLSSSVVNVANDIRTVACVASCNRGFSVLSCHGPRNGRRRAIKDTRDLPTCWFPAIALLLLSNVRGYPTFQRDHIIDDQNRSKLSLIRHQNPKGSMPIDSLRSDPKSRSDRHRVSLNYEHRSAPLRFVRAPNWSLMSNPLRFLHADDPKLARLHHHC